MIQLMTIYGIISTFNCAHIVFLNQVNSIMHERHCSVNSQVGNRAYQGQFKASCDEIIKLCNIKVKK